MKNMNEFPPVDEIMTDDNASSIERLARKTPWWGISISFHAAALLLLSYAIVFGNPVEPKPPVKASITPPPKEHVDIFPPPPTNPTPVHSNQISEVTEPIYVKPEDTVFEEEDPTPDHGPAGEDPTGIANANFRGPLTQDIIGAGNTGGSDKAGPGGRIGRKAWGIRDNPHGKTTEGAVLAALRWLARHQNPDGSWCAKTYNSRCRHGSAAGSCEVLAGETEFNPGITGLSLLAFLGAGYSHLSKDTHDDICFGDVIRRGLQWMMRNQDPEGCIGGRSCEEYMYNHTVCALAMTEAYGLTGSNLLKQPAQQAIDFIVAARNPDRVWRYSSRCGDNDTSVTGWAIMALKSAEMSGLTFPRTECYDSARGWFRDVTNTTYYRAGYDRRDTGKVYNEHNREFSHHDALAAISVMCRIFMDRNKRDPAVRGGCNLLVRDLPRWEKNEIDFYYWYYASLALFQYDGPKGSHWGQWNEHLVKALVPNQHRETGACANGSWDPVGRWCHDGDRVYATAINALTLEVYYRYANVFGGNAH